MKITLHKFTCFLARVVWFATAAAAQNQQPLTQPGNQFEWRFSLKPNQIVSSTITTENTCRKRHRFEIVSQPPFMSLAGESSFFVKPLSRHIFPVRFDSNGLKPGLYEGVVTVRCLSCSQEKGCSQD